MKVVLASINCSYIHTALGVRWLYVSRDKKHDTLIKDFTIKDSLENIVEEIMSSNPDLVGLSVYIYNADIMKELVVRLHEYNNKLRIIVGGPEVSYEYADWLELPIEAVLRGEGEVSFWQAVNKENPSLIDGYVNVNYTSSISYAMADLDYLETLESPFFLDFDNKVLKNKYLYLETSRGCPFTCSYCLSSLEKRIRVFSLDYVFKQLKSLEKNSCKQIKFLDRTFNVDSDRALILAKYIDDLDIDNSFEFEVMVEYLSEELLKFFEDVKPGRYRFEVGVQSFNQKTLKAVNRYQNTEKLVKNIKRLVEAGNIVHTDLIAGLPYEDYNSFKDSFNKLYSLKSTEMQIGILKLLRGTKLKSESKKYGIKVTKEVPYTTYQTNYLSKQDLTNITYLYHATEKLYNSNKMRYTLDYLFDDNQDIFEILVGAGELIDNHSKNIQLKDYFLYVYQQINKITDYDENKIKYLLMVDYYKLFKGRTSNIFGLKVDKKIIEKIFEKSEYSDNKLHNYAIVQYGYYQNKVIYQLIVYSKENKKPEIIWFNEDLSFFS
jgi:radical SAM superfamily enzyme YgiQ (UPF0313 family)